MDSSFSTPAQITQDHAPGHLRVRYDRLAIAVLGLGAALTFVLALMLLPFGVGSWGLPVVALLVTAGSVAVLRFLAVRDLRLRKAETKAEAADKRQVSPTAGPETVATAGAVQSPKQAGTVQAGTVQAGTVQTGTGAAEVFDSQEGQPSQKEEKPFTAEELREAALEVARAAERKAQEAGQAAEEPGAQDSADSWEPAATPKPGYVSAAKAERPKPEPLALPEQPKPTAKTSLKVGKAATARPAMSHPMLRKAGEKRAAQNNLDDVLQRRRA